MEMKLLNKMGRTPLTVTRFISLPTIWWCIYALSSPRMLQLEERVNLALSPRDIGRKTHRIWNDVRYV